MTPRERVYKTLDHKNTDVIPHHITFTAGSYNKMADYYGDENFIDNLGNHLATLSHRKVGAWTEVRPGHFRDEWGVIWNRTVDKDIGVVENKILPEPVLHDWNPPEPVTEALASAYPAFVAKNEERFRMASVGMSLFERAWSLRGMEDLLMDMYENPKFVAELFDSITSYNMAQLDVALSHDIDGVWFGDDWGSQVGLIMGPELWRQFIKPCLEKMYGRVIQAGKRIAIHSCGDIRAILPDLIDLGVSIYNPFQPETMDVFQIKNIYGDRMSFWGGISVQTLLPYGTPDEIRKEIERLLRVIGENGGYIAAPSHAIPADVPVENITAMIETLRSR